MQQKPFEIGPSRPARAAESRNDNAKIRPLVGGGQRPRVLYISDDEYPCDVRAEKICAALTANGFDVHLVARNRRWAPRSERLAEGIVHRMPPLRMFGRKIDDALAFPAFFNPRWVSLLATTIRRVRPDVIIVHDLPLCPTALWTAKRHGVAVVLDMAEHYCAASLMERYCLAHVDRILVVADEMRRRLASLGVSEERIDHAPDRYHWEQDSATLVRSLSLLARTRRQTVA